MHLAAWNTARRFSADKRGQFAVLFALLAIPIIALSGSGVDLVEVLASKSKLQNGADAAALAIVSSASAYQDQTSAVRTANAYLGADAPELAGQYDVPVVQFSTTGRKARVRVSARLPTPFLALVGVQTLPFIVVSTATADTLAPICALALNASASPAITFTGQNSFSGPKCVIWSNSTSTSSISLSGGATITSAMMCAVGNVVQTGSGTVSPAPQQGCAPIPDPFASVSIPEPGTCTDVNTVISAGSGSRTISPGVYCGGLTASARELKLEPGIYFIKDGPLSLQIHDNLVGVGVTFIMAGTGGLVSITSQGTLSISAPASGSMAGILLTHTRSQVGQFTAQIAGSSGNDLHGSIYLPNYQLHLTGSSSSNPKTSVVAGTLVFDGTGGTVMEASTTAKLSQYIAQFASPRLIE